MWIFSENLNSVDRVYCAFSTSVCIFCLLGQVVGAALSAQADAQPVLLTRDSCQAAINKM